MVRIITPGHSEFIKVNINQFVENVVKTFRLSLNEEHITSKDKLKRYRDYTDGAEVKKELGDLLNDFVNKYKHTVSQPNADTYQVVLNIGSEQFCRSYVKHKNNSVVPLSSWTVRR